MATNTPEQTLRALEKKPPAPYWIEINERLVPFGKHIRSGWQPQCNNCPLLSMCAQIGVARHRRRRNDEYTNLPRDL